MTVIPTGPTGPTGPTRPRRPRLARARRAHGGFTLLEVMIALALLGLGLTVLIKSAAGSIFNSQQAHMMGVATDLARAKMYDIEEKLLKDGFSDTEQHEEDQSFTDEGWPQIKYSYKVELVELPSFNDLQKLAQCHAGKAGSGGGSSGSAGSGSAGSGSGEASDEGCFENSALGGMMSQFGGGMGGFAGVGGGSGSGSGSGDIGAAVGASFVQGQYTMFQQILKVSLRKVSLTLNWKVLGNDRDMKVVQFLTDAAAMDKVIQGLGSQDLDDANAKGGGKGSGSGGGTTGGGKTGGGTTPGGGGSTTTLGKGS